MLGRFNALIAACGLAVLGFYCQATLAAEAVVNQATGAAPTTESVTIPVLNANGMPTEYNQKQVIMGSLMMFGRLFLIIAFFWLLINVMRKLAGGNPT